MFRMIELWIPTPHNQPKHYFFVNLQFTFTTSNKITRDENVLHQEPCPSLTNSYGSHKCRQNGIAVVISNSIKWGMCYYLPQWLFACKNTKTVGHKSKTFKSHVLCLMNINCNLLKQTNFCVNVNSVFTSCSCLMHCCTKDLSCRGLASLIFSVPPNPDMVLLRGMLAPLVLQLKQY